MDIATRLNLNAYRTGGSEQQPQVGASISKYTPHFLASMSAQSGTPNASIYADIHKNLSNNLNVAVGSSVTANEYGTFVNPQFSLNYNSQEKNSSVDRSMWNAGVSVSPKQDPQFYINYQRRF